MLPKPKECVGCPLYGSGLGFVPDEILPNPEAKVYVKGQNPGEDEVREGKPYVGKTGQDMEKTYFPAAGLVRGKNVHIGNTLRCRLEGHCVLPCNHLPTGKILQRAIEHCKVHEKIPPQVELVVIQGAIAWKSIGAPGTISEWRGFLWEN